MKTKKALKNEYKQMKPLAGVFQIKNNVNGKVLVEESVDVISKWNRYRSELRFGSHRNKILQSDWDQYGEDTFDFSIISEVKIDDDNGQNLNAEIKLLREMVDEEVNVQVESRY